MLVCVINSCAVILVQKWGAIEPHIEAKNNPFSTNPKNISGYDVTIPVPDVAQILVRIFFYLYIKFGAEPYALGCVGLLFRELHFLAIHRAPFCVRK